MNNKIKIIIIAICILLAAGLLLRDNSTPVSAHAEIDIEVPVADVWRLQTDIANWKKWNADIEEISISGPVKPGTEFIWKAGGFTIQSKILEVIPNKQIMWSGKMIGISAVHKWEFTERNGITHVYTEEEFKGFLAWLLPGTLRKTLQNSLDRGLNLLKQNLEKNR